MIQKYDMQAQIEKAKKELRDLCKECGVTEEEYKALMEVCAGISRLDIPHASGLV